MTQSFSNPLVEQRDFLAGTSAIELDDKAVITVSGEDRLSWLNDILSQKLDQLTRGDSTEALWLDAQGRIVRDFHIIDDGENTWLITFKNELQELLTQLQRMVFRSKVVIADRSRDFVVIASWGVAIKETFISCELPLQWIDPWPKTSEGGWRYGSDPTEPWEYREALVTVEDVPRVWQSFTKAGTMALDALRVAAFKPIGPNEIDEKSLPHESDWLATAVHLNKGCYRGQEAVAKVHNLGHPPRRLVFLHLDGSAHALPNSGDEVYLGEELVGKVTSVGQHFEMGPIALALVKRNVSLAAELTIVSGTERISATQEVIVPQSAGAVVDLGEFRARKK
ncbi:MAG: folate-binding protein [Micrococcales bacterium]|nr:folate-binding protein [Actinomycetota bacterium]NCA07445.1 folate-binding protein [Micrococcales bacterium]